MNEAQELQDHHEDDEDQLHHLQQGTLSRLFQRDHEPYYLLQEASLVVAVDLHVQHSFSVEQ